MGIGNIDNNYFFYKDGSKVIETDMARGDCFSLNTYLVLRHKYPHLYHLLNLLIDDICFGIGLSKDNKILDIDYKNNAMRNYEILKYSEFEYVDQGITALQQLENHIDLESIIIIQSINEWLPFSKSYDPTYKAEKYVPGHMQTIVGYDDCFFYYLEDPGQINYKNFVPYSKDVGVIDKKTARIVFGKYLKCQTVDVNFDKLKDIDYVIYNIVKESIKDYEHPLWYGDKGSVFSWGRKAIECLIEISKGEYIRLDVIDDNHGPINLYLRWKFRVIKNKRYYLYQYFKENENKYMRKDLVVLLRENYMKWNMIWNVFEKKYLRKEYIWDKSVSRYFEAVLELEDKIFQEFELLEPPHTKT